MTISRLGSVFTASTQPQLYHVNEGFGLPFFVGFCVCLFSLLNAVGMVTLDKKQEKQNPHLSKAQMSDDEKFKWSDLTKFKTPFWLLTFSCVLTYMSIFPYIQICSDLLQTKYNFSEEQAGHLFGIPYLISAVTSPFLGIMIDKCGRRALLIVCSSIVFIIAYVTSMNLKGCDQCYREVYPLVLVGIGYSIYAAAIWGSVPYTVPAQTVGSAFGICTAIQNIGMVIAPTIVGVIKQHNIIEHYVDPDGTEHFVYDYKWVDFFFICINVISLFLNLWLYIIDIKYYDGVLNKVEKGDQLEELMTSPEPGERKELLKKSLAKSRTAQGLVDYKLDGSAREQLKRSMAAKRPN